MQWEAADSITLERNRRELKVAVTSNMRQGWTQLKDVAHSSQAEDREALDVAVGGEIY